jgi:type II secretory pathway predicted ATPase ExeA
MAERSVSRTVEKLAMKQGRPLVCGVIGANRTVNLHRTNEGRSEHKNQE